MASKFKNTDFICFKWSWNHLELIFWQCNRDASSQLNDLGFATNECVLNSYDASIQQSISSVSTFPIVPPSYQRAAGQTKFNECVRSNEQVINATFVSKLTPNSATNQVLSNEGVVSYQKIPNSSVATNQQISNSRSAQLMHNTAATHRVTIPSSNSVPTDPQSNQYQSLMSNLGRCMQFSLSKRSSCLWLWFYMTKHSSFSYVIWVLWEL